MLGHSELLADLETLAILATLWEPFNTVSYCRISESDPDAEGSDGV